MNTMHNKTLQLFDETDTSEWEYKLRLALPPDEADKLIALCLELDRAVFFLHFVLSCYEYVGFTVLVEALEKAHAANL